MGLGDRRTEIMNLLGENGYMTVSELSGILGCSSVTIRSDLTYLDRHGLLVRTHGGATRVEKKGSSRLISTTMNEFETEKLAIARKATQLLSDGNIIFIDSGSTAVRMTSFLKDMNLTVVTNSFPVADVVRNYENIKLVFIGGDLHRETMGTMGPIANECINALNVDISFVGAAAFDNDGITSSNLIEAELKKAVISSADKVVFLADHSKYGRKAFAKVCAWKSIDVFVTDTIDPELSYSLDSAGVEIITTTADV